ncbi:fluoride efflux transporter FluC [Schaalia cardiffensis]|uniref:fluoride efflux transporter FluC n=1 Tax=Schaalia cardiffensis TaxID=181487 RepID=UPI0023F2D5E4|nr:CrcB family protein [Schaalia cardiffensis]
MTSLLVWIALAFGGALGAVSRWKFDLEVRSLIARRFEKRSQYSHKKPLQYSLEQRLQHSLDKRLQHSLDKRLQHSLDKRPLEKGNPPKSLLEKPTREEHHPHDEKPQEEPRKPLLAPMLGIGLVNVLGSFLLGLLIAAPMIDSELRLVVSSGFLAGFTTFSTAVMDSWTLWRSGRRVASFALLLGVWASALIALFFAFALGRFVFSAS